MDPEILEKDIITITFIARCLKMLNRRQSKILYFHFTISKGISKVSRRTSTICRFGVLNQVYRKSKLFPTNHKVVHHFFSFFFLFLFDYFQTISSNIFSTRKHRRALSRIFFVDGEYGFTTLKYFTIMLTH